MLKGKVEPLILYVVHDADFFMIGSKQGGKMRPLDVKFNLIYCTLRGSFDENYISLVMPMMCEVHQIFISQRKVQTETLGGRMKINDSYLRWSKAASSDKSQKLLSQANIFPKLSIFGFFLSHSHTHTQLTVIVVKSHYYPSID